VHADYGDEALCNPTFFAGMDGIMKVRKTFKTTSGVVAPLILEGMATS
jgi:hypothetical protein